MSSSIANFRFHDGIVHASDSRASRSRASPYLHRNVPMLPNMPPDFDTHFEQSRGLPEDRTSPRDCTPFGAVVASALLQKSAERRALASNSFSQVLGDVREQLKNIERWREASSKACLRRYLGTRRSANLRWGLPSTGLATQQDKL